MRRTSAPGLSLIALIGLTSPSLALAAPTETERLEFFESKVRPLLADQCLGCHGPEKQKAGLRLDSRQGMMRGGDSGPVIVPGKPDESRLIEVIRYDADIQMPPKRKLGDTEIAALTEWVRQGAAWPEPREPRGTDPADPAPAPSITAEDRAFWSFQPVRMPDPPPVRDPSWIRSPIDRFILAKLEARGLRPAPPAGPRPLLRRLTFDLIGLPPSPEEIEAFVLDWNRDSQEALRRAIDRLLASPHYGERWGRYWLDLARYGEDQAHSFQPRLYPYGWRYRDYVTNSFNEDKPYNQFIVEQLAGDLLDGPDPDARRAATGLLATGPVYYGKAVFDELNDRVDVVSRAFLGLTVACARCHDHKYDPIPQADYYALAGVFTSTDYKEYPAAPPAVIAAYEAGQAAIEKQDREINEFIKAESARLVEQTAATETARYLVAAWVLTNRRKSAPALATAEIAKAEQVDAEILDRWVTLLETDQPALNAWRRLLDSQDPRKDLSGDDQARAEAVRVADSLQADLQATLDLRDALQRQRQAAQANRGTAAPSPLELGEADLQLIRQIAGAGGPFRIAKDRVEKQLPPAIKTRLRELRMTLEKLKKEAPPKYPIIHGLTEARSVANMRIHLRGNPDNLGPEVPRHFLSVLSPESIAPFQQGSGRLELARAIASEDNPLTARVMVNRIWEHHFGRGLVRTSSNFGKLGDPPTHPELLDYLASRFITTGWSIKRLHREILLSATYQLSSAFLPENAEVDPENTLLWRANRRRLEVEPWRDAMLAVTGELQPTLGGPSLSLADAGNHRRTYYAAISRHQLDGLLRLFDFPDPNLTSDRRPETAAPPQQLFVLNSGFVLDRARALARRLTRDPNQTDAERIDQAYRLLFGRPPTEPEVRLGQAFLNSADTSGSLSGWEQYAQALLATNEFLYLD